MKATISSAQRFQRLNRSLPPLGSHGRHQLRCTSGNLNDFAPNCQDYLEVYSKVDEGYSAWRGKLLEEFVGPLMLQSKDLLQNNKIDMEKYVMTYTKCIRMIKEASKCRQYEPQSSANFFAWSLKEINDVISTN